MLISFVMIAGAVITAFEYLMMGDFESFSLLMETFKVFISDGFVGLSGLLEQILASF